MAIPDFQTIMLPLLQFSGDDREHSIREAIASLAEFFQLTEADRTELLPSGKQATFDNRVGWAKTYLKKAGLLESPKRGTFKITQRGRDVLKASPSRIDINYLGQFSEFMEFQTPNRDAGQSAEAHNSTDSSQTPEEYIERGYQQLRKELASDLLASVKTCSAEFFERLVVDLLVNMGYGGSRRDAGQAIGKSGDGGIDGIIKEDRLGLDVVYIQAKKWENTVVGRPEIQKFVGALHGQRARKGVFITTSNFSTEAKEYVRIIDSKIILIDGHQLAQYMIDYGIGVSIIANYEIKKMDSDYFVEE